ncbi:IS30 family transposase [Lactiplantibacillus pentosus]|uniref:IS30 family transposase n=1 Tax=Lactiplantibacillus pentosus TaxID=1589 RepID=UPI003C249270
MSYKHLTIFERESVLKLQARGHSIRSIAYRLKRSPSTISREIRRCKGNYSPNEAENDYRKQRAKCHKPLLLDQCEELCELVAKLILDSHWSPQQIANRLTHENYFCVSYTTIYRHIKRHNLNRPYHSHGDTGIKRRLRHSGRIRHPKGERRHEEAKVDYISIHERPKFIDQRKRIGDWEIDTVIGRTGHAILLTVVDRLSRLTFIKKVAQKDSQEINKGLVELLGAIPKEFVHSITPNHGTEFLHLDEISERLGVTVYWPDPYSPEQRGTNENTNGLIREYFPKRTDIDNYTEQDVEHCQKQLNQRPRKVLNYETPYEVFFDKPLHLV